MKCTYRQIELKKRYPLRISRGVSAGSTNLYVMIKGAQHVGIGEAAPGTGAETATVCEQQLTKFLGHQDIGSSIFDAWSNAYCAGIPMCAWAAIDMAKWDLLAKQSGQPLYRLLGLPKCSVATSVTIGILTPDVVRDRVPEILNRTGAKHLKIKLGSTDGIEADQAMYSEVQETVRDFGVSLRVDANGGWSLSDATSMMLWLRDRNCDYIEQPLKSDLDDQLPVLFKDRTLPIFIDESCSLSTDVARLADCIDGVNVKLMKCGGITEALRIVATARAHKLQTMIGCMSESSIAIAAGATIGALFDHIDLDSHLNLAPDPASGLDLAEGVVRISDASGHGAKLIC